MIQYVRVRAHVSGPDVQQVPLEWCAVRNSAAHSGIALNQHDLNICCLPVPQQLDAEHRATETAPNDCYRWPIAGLSLYLGIHLQFPLLKI
jgi:hypothetical protein